MAFRVLVFMVFFTLSGRGDLFAQVDARLFRFPDVSERHICFVYAGDVWVVEKRGGTARRLSSPRGEELFPRFSPDGSRIAFSANYDGNLDVYVVPALGGEPLRITYHPSPDLLADWYPDGSSLLFASSRESGVPRLNQLFKVPAGGGLPRKLPLAYGEYGALSADSRQLAFVTKNREFRTWKRYRGGLAPEIWLFNLETKEARNLSRSDANDMQPMWHGNTLYFLSDRDANQRSNIWALDLRNGRTRQVTQFTEYDIAYPAIGPSDIVFQAGGRLYLLDLESEKYRELSVDVVTDLATLRPQNVKVSRLIQGGRISPSGKRAVIEARGEIYSLPAEHGPVRNLTRTSEAAERYPSWAPDGGKIAYWTDRSGEYQLALRSPTGGEEEILTELGPGYRYRIFWSPDSKKIAFVDHAQIIWMFDVEEKKFSEVDRGLWMLHGQLAGFTAHWSRDSRWLAYSRGLETENEAVFLYDCQEETRHQVTSGYYNDSSPAFDPDGKYLYYLSNRSLSPIYSDLDATWIYPNSTRIVSVPLRQDVPSPLAPRNDDEEGTEPQEKEDAKEGEEQEGQTEEGQEPGVGEEPGAEKDSEKTEESGEGEKTTKPVEIDLEGFEARGVVLPPEAGNYRNLEAVSGKVVYHRLPRTGASGRNRPILFFDLKERKEETIVETAGGFDISADGKKMLVMADGNWSIVDVAARQKVEKKLATSDLEATIDPRKEWKQIFREVWRTYRDYFYDPSMHGLDWEAMGLHYGELIGDAVTRWDVNFIIGELIGEVNASHTYVGGGDTESAESRQVGLIGIDWATGDGAYRVGRIVRGAPWDIETRSPLAEPGVDVREGDYILAVNGIPIDLTRDPSAAFEGLGGKTVMLTVNRSPEAETARQVLVETLASETRLRHLEWVEGNRKRVDEATGGQVGYIYVPNTGLAGQTELVRQFNFQMRRKGLIIDERFNAGGQLPDRFIEQMDRQMVNRISFRNGGTITHPRVSHYGPKVMLINGWAGSGGDAFPYFFKGLKVGTLVGERTWGGLIGPAVGHATIDGGRYTAPPGRIFGPDGQWFPEGHGVDPDIQVVDDPGELARGRDPQLEAAIEEVMRLVRENPPGFPEPPPFEKRVARGRSRPQ